MITDKDKSKIKRYICKSPIFCHLELVEKPYGDLVKYDNHVKLVAESAEQARKEAAEKAVEWVMKKLVPGVFADIIVQDLRYSILVDNDAPKDTHK